MERAKLIVYVLFLLSSPILAHLLTSNVQNKINAASRITGDLMVQHVVVLKVVSQNSSRRLRNNPGHCHAGFLASRPNIALESKRHLGIVPLQRLTQEALGEHEKTREDTSQRHRQLCHASRREREKKNEATENANMCR